MGGALGFLFLVMFVNLSETELSVAGQ